MPRILKFVVLALVLSGFAARADPAQDAATQKLIDRLEADDQAYRADLARKPLPDSEVLTLTKRTLAALSRDRAFLADACQGMTDIPEYVDVWETTRLSHDTFKAFALAYNEAAIEDLKRRVGPRVVADRARCLAVKRAYRASIETFAAQLARLKQMGY